MEERYQKVKWAVERFMAFQVGLSTFKWCKSTKKYVIRPFCFYVFPHGKRQEE